MAYKEPRPTVAIVLDSRYKKVDKTYPVKLRVTYCRVQNYFPIPDEDSKSGGSLSLKVKEFNTVYIGTPKTERGKLIRTRLQAYESKARKAAESLSPFTWDSFKRQFLPGKPASDTLNGLLFEKVDRLKNEERFSSAKTYESALSCLERFSDKSIHVNDITEDLLIRWKRMMKAEEGLSDATVGIYFRCARVLMNECIENSIIKLEQYPFKKRGLIPTSRNIKKSLTMAEIQKIYAYKCAKGSMMSKCRDLWMFSYLCNGANLKDISNMKYSHIDKDKWTFVRAKTKNRNPSPITAIITDEAQQIIKRSGNPRNIKTDNYVFDILNKDMNPEEQYKATQQMIKTINKYMDRIRTDLKIECKVTTYFARHSWASIMKRAGVPIAFISESLGHSNMVTTQNYLAGFEDEAKREHSKKLLISTQ